MQRILADWRSSVKTLRHKPECVTDTNRAKCSLLQAISSFSKHFFERCGEISDGCLPDLSKMVHGHRLGSPRGDVNHRWHSSLCVNLVISRMRKTGVPARWRWLNSLWRTEGYILSNLAEMEISFSLHCLLEPLKTTMFILSLHLSNRGVCVVVSLQQLRAFRAIIHLKTLHFQPISIDHLTGTSLPQTTKRY
jgi:hypothetical protein